jgi:hypothetical protein
MLPKKRILSFLLLLIVLLPIVYGVSAHAPLSGEVDNENLDKALVLTDPLKSWVIYKELHTAGEANYYKFDLDQNQHITANLLIPISEKDTFLPGLIIMGPGIPNNGTAPSYVQVPNGTHVMVIEGKKPTKASYEPFTPASSYFIVDVEMNVTEKGTYYLVVFDSSSGGKYSLAIGYKEEFTVSEWLLIPFNLISIHIWEGQNIILLLAPLYLTILLGIILIIWKRPQTFRHLPAWTGIPAGLLCLGSGLLTLTQMVYALSIAPDMIALVTLIFAVIPIVLGYAILRTFLKNIEKITRTQRIVLVICGALGLVIWAGVIVGPVLAIVTAFLPFTLIMKRKTIPREN